MALDKKIIRVSGRKRLTKSLELLLVGILLIVPKIASGQAPPRFYLPLGGHTFYSSTAAGIGIVGAFNVETFENENGQLLVTGIVQADVTTTGVDTSTLPADIQAALAPDGTVLTLPVQIVKSTCREFQMQVGPVGGLTDPILVSVGKGKQADDAFENDQLSYSCKLAEATKSKNTDQLVVLLNQSEGIGTNGCDFLDAIKCSFAAATCGGACLAGPVACLACLGSIGYVSCKDCLGI